MNKISLLVFFLVTFLVQEIQAQYAVTIKVESPGGDTVYLAGNINGWNPADERYQITQNRVFIKNVSGIIEFKFTKGNWNSVEVNEDGSDITNRVFKITSDTTLTCIVKGWKKTASQSVPKHTATARVQMLCDSFYVPELQRYKSIWVYLPADYQTATGKRYPVIYMHDGQNLFDAARSSFGEWQADETIDSITAAIGRSAIVVGIDNDPVKRMNEYNPYSNQRFGTGEGDAYLSFITNTLKPYVDSNLRTLADAEHTAIAGSSMGGLISLYALIKHPETFGCAGIFSPAFWIAPSIKDVVTQMRFPANTLFYFYAGELESDEMVPDMLDVLHLIDTKRCCKTFLLTNSEGQHNEKYWQKPFGDFFTWWMQKISTTE